jgi:single-strand DNA-binding protein
MNVVVLQGTLSSEPVVRELRSGSVVWSFEITTRDDEGAASSVPVSWFDPPAPPGWASGDDVVVRGVVRRRFFRSGGGTQSRTEVVAELVVSARDRRKVARALERARSALGARPTPARSATARVEGDG